MEKEISKLTKSNLRKTFLSMLLVILSMALVFNFEVKLAWSHGTEVEETNVILWPIKQVMELLVYKGFGMSEGHWASTVSFFLTDVPYVFLIVVIFSYAFNFARSFSTDQEISTWLAGSDGIKGRVTGAVLGFVSPFCSCSTIPVMTTLLKSRAPFGTVISFLITSPMINESGIALMWGFFGWKVSLIYMAFGFVAGIVGSYIATALKLQNSPKIKPEPIVEGVKTLVVKNSWARMHRKAITAMKDIIKQIWWILILALAIGAVMHGWIPEDWIKNQVGNAWWAPLALIPIGLLIYLNISATLPLTNSFVKGGLGLGPALGFTMAVNTISLPEMLMLTKLFNKKFMIFFITYLLVAILLFSYMMLAIPDAALAV